MNDLISVIITTYNRPDKVMRAVKSVLGQTYGCIEIIVVDDGSDEDVSSCIKNEYGDTLYFIKLSGNNGAPYARNAGIRQASGKYIAFLDDDDVWENTKLEKQLSVFVQAKSNVGLVYCGFSYINNDNVFMKYYPKYKGEVFRKLLHYNFVGSTSIPLIKTEALKVAGFFDENFKSFQDWDMWLRILENYSADYVNEVLVKREVHGSQITGDIEKKLSGRKYYVEKYHDYLIENKPYLSHQYRALSDNYFLLGSVCNGIDLCLKSFIVNPISFASIFNLVLIIIPQKLRVRLILDKKTQLFGKVRFYR